jgi:hypothetical protein
LLSGRISGDNIRGGILNAGRAAGAAGAAAGLAGSCAKALTVISIKTRFVTIVTISKLLFFFMIRFY